jgi:hypothetical protein
VSPHDGRVQVVDIPIELSLGIFSTLERLEDAIPHSCLSPAVETARHRPPRSVSFRQVAPRGSGTIYPEDAVYDAAMIGVRTASFWFLGWQVWLQKFPLLVGQISSSHTDSVPTQAFCKHALVKGRESLFWEFSGTQLRVFYLSETEDQESHKRSSVLKKSLSHRAVVQNRSKAPKNQS